MTLRIAYQADREFKTLCDTIDPAFERETKALHQQRKDLARKNKDVENPKFFNRAVKTMRKERNALVKQCLRSYPSDPLMKYNAISTSKARILELLARQRKELKYLPFTQSEADHFYIDRTTAIADNALKDLYDYPLKEVWAKRIEMWGQKWDREAFAEKCLDLARRHRWDKDVEVLVDKVKNAVGKEQAYHRFVAEINRYAAGMKKKINEIERPSLARRVGWVVRSWLRA